MGSRWLFEDFSEIANEYKLCPGTKETLYILLYVNLLMYRLPTQKLISLLFRKMEFWSWKQGQNQGDFDKLVAEFTLFK